MSGQTRGMFRGTDGRNYVTVFAFVVPPILPDFQGVRVSLAAFLHFHHKQKHSQGLILPTLGKHGEIALLLHFADKGILDLQFCVAFRTDTMLCRFFLYPFMAAVHAGCPTLGQSVCEVTDTLTERPRKLRL